MLLAKLSDAPDVLYGTCWSEASHGSRTGFHQDQAGALGPGRRRPALPVP